MSKYRGLEMDGFNLSEISETTEEKDLTPKIIKIKAFEKAGVAARIAKEKGYDLFCLNDIERKGIAS